jgi:hypothetical protein
MTRLPAGHWAAIVLFAVESNGVSALTTEAVGTVAADATPWLSTCKATGIATTTATVPTAPIQRGLLLSARLALR